MLNTNRVGTKLLGPIESFNALIAIYKYTSFKISKFISFKQFYRRKEGLYNLI